MSPKAPVLQVEAPTMAAYCAENLASTPVRGGFYNLRRTRRCLDSFIRNGVVADASQIIRVCVNRSCARQGSREIMNALSAMAPIQEISVVSCGCLGRCGSGPNVAILPRGAVVGHCATAAHAVQLLVDLLGTGFEPAKNLEALALRNKGEAEMVAANYSVAETLFSKALDLNPSGGLHLILRNRSVARLGLGNAPAALVDAQEASALAPCYPQAFLSQGDAFLAMDKWEDAEQAYSVALSLDSSLRRSKSFKVIFARWPDFPINGSAFKDSRETFCFKFNLNLLKAAQFHM